MDFGISLYGAWWFSIIYLIFSVGLWFIFPKYVQIRFNKVPEIGIINKLYFYSYILLLLFSIIIPFKINLFLFAGSFLFTFGLAIFISALYQFAITDINSPAVDGVYSLSRHPVYMGFSIMWIGVFIATLNLFILILIIVLSYLSYIIAKEEEIYCLKVYGKIYMNYQKKVNFFIGWKS